MSISIFSNQNYARMGTIPGVQTILGVTAFCKNLIGMIKDIAMRTLYNKSTTECNTMLYSRIQLESELVEQLYRYKELSVEDQALLLPEIEKYIGIIFSTPLDTSTQEKVFKMNTSISLSTSVTLTELQNAVKAQVAIHNAIKKVEWNKLLYNSLKVSSFSHRIQALSSAIITAIPVIGSIYNYKRLASFKRAYY